MEVLLVGCHGITEEQVYNKGITMKAKLLIFSTTLGLLTITAFCSNTISIGSDTINVVFAEMTRPAIREQSLATFS